MKSLNDDINYTREAFLSKWNLYGLAAALVLSVLAGAGDGDAFLLLFLFTCAAELLYLGIVPQTERYRNAVRARRTAERHKPPSPRQIYRQLTRSNQRRYVHLRNVEESIRANYSKLSYASQGLLKSHLKKIGGLLDSYLHLLYQKECYRDHSDSAAESEVRRSIATLRENMEEDSSRVRSINKRRLRILEQRLESFNKSHENYKVIEAQLDTISDVIKYIHEQSWTLKNPEEITLQLDTLLDEVEETQASVAEVEEVFNPSFEEGLGELDVFSEEPASSDERQHQRARTRS